MVTEADAITPVQGSRCSGCAALWETEAFLSRSEAYHDYAMDTPAAPVAMMFLAPRTQVSEHERLFRNLHQRVDAQVEAQEKRNPPGRLVFCPALYVVRALLHQFGSPPGRPRVDTLNGSSHTKMKERCLAAAGGEWRVTVAFTSQAQRDLADGRDKSGERKAILPGLGPESLWRHSPRFNWTRIHRR